MKHITGPYPRLKVDTAGSAAVGKRAGSCWSRRYRTSGDRPWPVDRVGGVAQTAGDP